MRVFAENLKNTKTKTVVKRLTAIMQRIETRSQQLKADSALAQDFAPIDDEKREGIDQRNQDSIVDPNDGCDSKPTAEGSDASEAESFRICVRICL